MKRNNSRLLFFAIGFSLFTAVWIARFRSGKRRSFLSRKDLDLRHQLRGRRSHGY